MTAKLIITILTRGDDLEQHVPVGFRFVDEMYAEAGLRDSISAAQVETIGQRLRVIGRALGRALPGQVALRVLNPWTPRGLWFAFRRRVRYFPCIEIGGRLYPLDTPLDDLVEAARQVLSS